jgi:hypothetical protein
MGKGLLENKNINTHELESIFHYYEDNVAKIVQYLTCKPASLSLYHQILAYLWKKGRKVENLNYEFQISKPFV